MIRTLLTLLAFALTATIWSSPRLLILIPHEVAGPNQGAEAAIHPEWIRWPEAGPPSSQSQLLSITSGVDWRGDVLDPAFRPIGRQRWQARNHVSLTRRGYFAAQKQAWGGEPTVVVRTSRDGVSPSALLLGLAGGSPEVATQRFAEPLPREGTVIASALSWDDVQSLADRCPSRTLIVEYPPSEGGWSRFWRRGEWPSGVAVDPETRVPGVVPARHLATLLRTPEKFKWQPIDAGRWGGADRWFTHVRATGEPVLALQFWFAAVVAFFAIYLVMNESRGPLAMTLLAGCLLLPSIVVQAGTLSWIGGIDSSELWAMLAAVASVGISGAGIGLQRWRGSRDSDLTPIAWTGLVTMLLCDPRWSDYGGVFGPKPVAVPAVPLALMFGAFAWVSASVHTNLVSGQWLGRLAAALLVVVGGLTNPWWIAGHPSLLAVPVLAQVAAEGKFRWPLYVVAAVLPTSLLPVVRGGFVWTPGGRVQDVAEVNGFDLSAYMAFLVSPLFLASAVSLALALLLGSGFVAYRARALLRKSASLRALALTSGATAAVGLSEPVALAPAVVMALGGALAMLHEALRSP